MLQIYSCHISKGNRKSAIETIVLFHDTLALSNTSVFICFKPDISTLYMLYLMSCIQYESITKWTAKQGVLYMYTFNRIANWVNMNLLKTCSAFFHFLSTFIDCRSRICTYCWYLRAFMLLHKWKHLFINHETEVCFCVNLHKHNNTISPSCQVLLALRNVSHVSSISRIHVCSAVSNWFMKLYMLHHHLLISNINSLLVPLQMLR